MTRLSKNIVYNLLGQGLLLALSLVAVKLVFSRLGPDTLGILYFSITLGIALYAILEMGVSTTVVREVSTHLEDESGYLRDLIRTATLLYWGAYALLATSVYLAAPTVVGWWLTLSTLDTDTATRMVRVLGTGTLLLLPSSLYASLLRGTQRMEFNNGLDVARAGAQQLGIIIILAFGGGSLAIAYWFSVSFVLALIGYFLATARFFPLGALMPGYSSTVVLQNVRYSISVAAVSVLSTVHLQADKLIISKLYSVGAFGFYGLAFSVVARLTVFTRAVSQAALPTMSSLFRIGEHDDLLRQYRKLQDVVCFLAVPTLAAVAFAAEPLFAYLLDGKTARMLLIPVALLCIGTYMNSTLSMPYIVSLATGRPDIPARLNFHALFVTLPATAILVYFLGFPGAGLSWILYHLFSYVYAVPRICSQCLKIPTREWFWHTFKVSVLAFLTYGVTWLVIWHTGTDSIPMLAALYADASVVYAIGMYCLVGDELRGTVQGILLSFQCKRA